MKRPSPTLMGATFIMVNEACDQVGSLMETCTTHRGTSGRSWRGAALAGAAGRDHVRKTGQSRSRDKPVGHA
jgi:hypothetical protein